MSLVLWCHCLGHVSSKDCASVIFYLADKCTKVIIWVNISTPHLIFLQHENNSCHAPRDFLYTYPFSYSNKSNIIVIILLEHFQMALDTIQILGGNGYLNDYPAGWDEHKMNYFLMKFCLIPGRFLRDAKIYEIGAGTQEVKNTIST